MGILNYLGKSNCKCSAKHRHWENIEKMYKRTGKIAIFHGISRKTAHITENHYAVRVTAVKLRNRLALAVSLGQNMILITCLISLVV